MGSGAGADGGRVIDVAGLAELVSVLARQWTVVGPTVRGGGIVLGEIHSVDDLPRGVGDEQEAAHYRTTARADGSFFGFAATAQPWKSVLFPPRELISRARRSEDGWRLDAATPDADPEADDGERPGPPYALLGIRSCDLHALAIHDRVLLEREAVDDRYAARRRDAFVVTVTCAQPSGTCFCVSMGTGPRAERGFDLALTELLEPEHVFVVEVGSDRGAAVLAEVATRPASAEDLAGADEVAETARGRMGRSMDPVGLRDLLYANATHPRWDDVATRCLSCTNCTMSCPTCFCTTVEDVTDLTGTDTERWRAWDSCFTADFSYIHGGSVRTSPRSRYRQWMTHKLASWVDQFGTSGCVGCGRCITWCPAAIDITEEVAAIRADPLPGTEEG